MEGGGGGGGVSVKGWVGGSKMTAETGPPFGVITETAMKTPSDWLEHDAYATRLASR